MSIVLEGGLVTKVAPVLGNAPAGGPRRAAVSAQVFINQTGVQIWSVTVDTQETTTSVMAHIDAYAVDPSTGATLTTIGTFDAGATPVGFVEVQFNPPVNQGGTFKLDVTFEGGGRFGVGEPTVNYVFLDDKGGGIA